MDEIEVYYQDYIAGQLMRNPHGKGTLFFYTPEFIELGMELSPLRLPTSVTGAQLKDADKTMSLPGMIYDTLPDSFGTRMIQQWFARKGYPEPTVFEMLAFIGNQGFGALHYRPLVDAGDEAKELDLDEIDQKTKEVEQLFSVEMKDEIVRATSAPGGAQRKAIVFEDRETGALLDKPAAGRETNPLLVKFPDTSRLSNPEIEHSYCELARACGIRAQETKLIEVQGRSKRFNCFAARRFDRDGLRRIHYHSFKGMTEGIYDHYATADYVDLAAVTLRLTEDFSEVKEVYRRALFNVLVDNTDDHAKNHGFLFDGGQWVLSPAFDLTYRGSSGAAERGLRVMGRANMFSRQLMHEFAGRTGLDRRSVGTLDEEVIEGLKSWKSIAEENGVEGSAVEIIARSHYEALRIFGEGK